MNTIKCPNCGYENKNTNIRCESCGKELSHIKNNDYQKNVKTIDLENKKVKGIISVILIFLHAPWFLFSLAFKSKKVKYIANAILIFILAPWFLIGLLFIGVSLYSNITDYSKSKNYLETEGKLVSYENCQYDDGNELCSGVYEYTVSGVTYKGSPNLLSNRSGFKQNIIVKYNPNNPNEYVIDSGWNWLLIVGIIIVSVVVVIFISVKIPIKKSSKKVKNIEKDNQVSNRVCK